jgi:hypothetical protein
MVDFLDQDRLERLIRQEARAVVEESFVAPVARMYQYTETAMLRAAALLLTEITKRELAEAGHGETEKAN